MPSRAEQKVVVRWMRCQLDRLGWVPERWAQEAGLSPTTVTRAMSEKYESVSTVTTLHALAKAAGIPTVLDFLAGQASLQPQDYPVLSAVLDTLLPRFGCELDSEAIAKVAEAIGAAIAGLAVQDDEH